MEPVRLFRVARAGSGLDEPPYGGSSLARVTGLSPPEPAHLEKAVRRRERRLFRMLSAVRQATAGAALGAMLLFLLVLGGVAATRWWQGQPGRLISHQRFQEALAAIEARAARVGPEDPGVLFLRGQLEAARADARAGGRLDQAFEFWSRALAAGSAEAGAALLGEARSQDCARRLLAARALADSGADAARPALEELARAEPPEGLLGFLPDTGRCGAGDVAREGLEAHRQIHSQ